MIINDGSFLNLKTRKKMTNDHEKPIQARNRKRYSTVLNLENAFFSVLVLNFKKAKKHKLNKTAV